MRIKTRRITQPGPSDPIRITSFVGRAKTIDFTLEAGLTLCDAIARPLAVANLSSAGVLLKNLRVSPMSYVIPTFSTNPDHVAYYSETYSPADEIEVAYANATFGRREGSPFIHCHALWEDNNRIHGGHILPMDSVVAVSARATAVGTTTITMDSLFDPETNFTLFHPVINETVESLYSAEKCVVATIRSNEDLSEAIETICRDHQIRDAEIRSGIGSIVGAQFEDGRCVSDIPTELLVLEGRVSTDDQGNCRASVEVALIDTHGVVHKGRLARGLNPVLICFELVLTAMQPIN